MNERPKRYLRGDPDKEGIDDDERMRRLDDFVYFADHELATAPEGWGGTVADRRLYRVEIRIIGFAYCEDETAAADMEHLLTMLDLGPRILDLRHNVSQSRMGVADYSRYEEPPLRDTFRRFLRMFRTTRTYETPDGRTIPLGSDDEVVEYRAQTWLLRVTTSDIVSDDNPANLRWVYVLDPRWKEPFRYKGSLYQDKGDGQWYARPDRGDLVRSRDRQAAIDFLAFGDDPR